MQDLVELIEQYIAAGKLDRAMLESSRGTVTTFERKVVVPEFPYTCPACDKRAKSQRGLTKHMNSRHGGLVATPRASDGVAN